MSIPFLPIWASRVLELLVRASIGVELDQSGRRVNLLYMLSRFKMFFYLVFNHVIVLLWQLIRQVAQKVVRVWAALRNFDGLKEFIVK